MAKRGRLPKGIDFKDGSYRCRITRNGMKVTRLFDTLPDAKAWIERQRIEMEADDYGEQQLSRAKARAYTLNAVLEDYLKKAVPALAESAQAAARNRVRMWQRQPWAALPIVSIRQHHISEWMAAEAQRTTRRGGTPKATTIGNAINLLSAVFRFAITELHLDIKNPVKGMRRPAAEPPRASVPDADLEALILDRARQSQARWVEPFIVLAAWTAMRQGEIRRLRWEWIHLDDGFIILPGTAETEAGGPAIRITKTRKERGIPLLPMVRDALRDWRGNHDGASGWVFPSVEDPSRPMPTATVTSAWRRLYAGVRTDRPNLRHQTFHDFRHWGCTRLAGYHDSVLELASTTGHKTLQMLARYYDPEIKEKTERVMRRWHEIHGQEGTDRAAAAMPGSPTRR